jgi:hypothetical protein
MVIQGLFLPFPPQGTQK